MKTLRFALLAVTLTLFGCGSGPKDEAGRYVDFLYAYMPHPDLAAHPYDYWEANVAKTLEVRDRMAWGIP